MPVPEDQFACKEDWLVLPVGLRVEIVAASAHPPGSKYRLSAEQEADLYWGRLSSGSNFRSDTLRSTEGGTNAT